MKSLARIGIALLPALILLVLIFHFVMTLAFLTPINPVKLHYDRWNLAYMQPFFSQNWRLFAPNPANDSRVLLVDCRVQQPNGEVQAMGWADISTALREMYHQNRFSPADRIDRLQATTVRTIFQVDPTIETLKQGRENSEHLKQLIETLEEAKVSERELALDALNRVASAHCDRLYGAERTSEVRVRMAILTFPRFSQRHLPDEDGKLEYVTFEWAPHQKVAPIFTGGA
jgi:hypothetical protein